MQETKQEYIKRTVINSYEFIPITHYFTDIEIHPVCIKLVDLEDGGIRCDCDQCEPEEADIWSVYVRYLPEGEHGGCECIADFLTEDEANKFRMFLLSVIEFARVRGEDE